MAVVAPIPKARHKMATRLKFGVRTMFRRICRKLSPINPSSGGDRSSHTRGNWQAKLQTTSRAYLRAAGRRWASFHLASPLSASGIRLSSLAKPSRLDGIIGGVEVDDCAMFKVKARYRLPAWFPRFHANDENSGY